MIPAPRRRRGRGPSVEWRSFMVAPLDQTAVKLIYTLVALSCLTLYVSLPEALVAAGEDGLAVAATSLSAALRRPRGRPRKFDEPTRVVSLTLPEWAIERLAQTHADLGRAVIGLLGQKASGPARPAAELVIFGNHAVISVRPTPSLERRLGVQLVPQPDGRALLAFDAPRAISDLELSIGDALDDDSLSRDDRAVYDSLRSILREARQANDVSLLRRSIIVLEGPRRSRRSRKTARPA